MKPRPSSAQLVLAYLQDFGLPRFSSIDGVSRIPAISGKPGEGLGEVDLARFALDRFSRMASIGAVDDALRVLEAIAKEQA
jgi:hypothetical protein